MNLIEILKYSEVVISVAIVVVVILQTRSGGVGNLFGGGSSGGLNSSKRGMEAVLYNVTIVLGILFGAVALLIGALSV